MKTQLKKSKIKQLEYKKTFEDMRDALKNLLDSWGYLQARCPRSSINYKRFTHARAAYRNSKRFNIGK